MKYPEEDYSYISASIRIIDHKQIKIKFYKLVKIANYTFTANVSIIFIYANIYLNKCNN